MVRRHCPCHPYQGYGRFFVVENVVPAHNYRPCDRPEHWLFGGESLAQGDAGAGWGHHPVSWLKRIPPLSELEGQRTQEDIKEPA